MTNAVGSVKEYPYSNPKTDASDKGESITSKFSWFFFILFKFTYYLFSNSEIINYYLSFQLFSILLMFFFQAEEVSTLLGVSIGLIILEGYKNE